MSVRRLEDIPGFNIDRVAAAAGDDPDVLRMENLDTDIPPPAEAIEATRAAIGEDEANSWLPFTGRDDLKEAVAAYIERRGGPRYDGRREIVITCGEGEAMLDALFCLTDPGDEVILTDPTYAGMLNRVRLVGAVPRLVPLRVVDGEWRLDLDALPRRGDRPHARRLRQQRVVPDRLGGERRGVGRGRAIWRERDLWLLYWGGFEGVLFDGRSVIHPAALPGMRDRTVTVGAPVRAAHDRLARRLGGRARGARERRVARADLQRARGQRLRPDRRARRAREPDDDLAAANAEWQRRRDETLRQLDGLPVVPAAGAWSLLLDVAALGLDCARSRSACSSRRSRRRRCAAGAARSPTATCASCSATSRSSGWRCSGPRPRGTGGGPPSELCRRAPCDGQHLSYSDVRGARTRLPTGGRSTVCGYDFTVRARHDGLEDTRDSAGLSALVVICSGASTLTRMRGSARRRVVVRGGATQRGDVNLAATRCLRMGLCVAPSKYALQGM